MDVDETLPRKQEPECPDHDGKAQMTKLSARFCFDQVDGNDLAEVVHSMFADAGYSLEKGSKRDGIYGLGSAFWTLLSGPFEERYAWHVLIDDSEESTVLEFSASRIGWLGGYFAMKQIRAEYQRITDRLDGFHKRSQEQSFTEARAILQVKRIPSASVEEPENSGALERYLVQGRWSSAAFSIFKLVAIASYLVAFIYLLFVMYAKNLGYIEWDISPQSYAYTLSCLLVGFACTAIFQARKRTDIVHQAKSISRGMIILFFPLLYMISFTAHGLISVFINDRLERVTGPVSEGARDELVRLLGNVWQDSNRAGDPEIDFTISIDDWYVVKVLRYIAEGESQLGRYDPINILGQSFSVGYEAHSQDKTHFLAPVELDISQAFFRANTETVRSSGYSISRTWPRVPVRNQPKEVHHCDLIVPFSAPTSQEYNRIYINGQPAAAYAKEHNSDITISLSESRDRLVIGTDFIGSEWMEYCHSNLSENSGLGTEHYGYITRLMWDAKFHLFDMLFREAIASGIRHETVPIRRLTTIEEFARNIDSY